MVTQKILITGAAGYIGGTALHELLNPATGTPMPASNIITIIRNPGIATKIAKLGVEVSNVSLTDESGIENLIIEKGVHLVVHFAGALEFGLATPLIKALATQKKKTGREVHFIHTSGTSGLAEAGGWKHGLVRDTDNVYEMEKSTQQSYVVRDTNIVIYEIAKELGVNLSTVAPPLAYGEGTGEGGRQTIITPVILRAAIALRTLHKDRTEGTYPMVHVTDLAKFYVLLIRTILDGRASTAEVTGYFYPVAHYGNMWETAQEYAKVLYSKGLIDSPEPVEWSSDEQAAEALGMPLEFVPLIYRSNQQVESIRPKRLGWEAEWDNKRYLASRADDVDVYLKLLNAYKQAEFKDAVHEAKKSQ